jgi:hypothetical protein
MGSATNASCHGFDPFVAVVTGLPRRAGDRHLFIINAAYAAVLVVALLALSA